MKIRRANNDDHPQIRQLFYDTITGVNKKDYSPQQITVWSAGYLPIEKWTTKIKEQHFFVAEIDKRVVGFASICNDGYLDYMYCHKDFQGQGIATALLNTLEEIAAELNLKEIWAHVSITARPFFKSKGFELTSVYTTVFDGVEFEDSTMTKVLTSSNNSEFLS